MGQQYYFLYILKTTSSYIPRFCFSVYCYKSPDHPQCSDLPSELRQRFQTRYNMWYNVSEMPLLASLFASLFEGCVTEQTAYCKRGQTQQVH